jgi:ATP-dependent DNA helicase RecQ
MHPQEILQNFFGHSEFKNGQLEIITAIMNRENVLAILPTGGGKSVCYQIPALMAPAFSIVISPLIALMKDQVDSINRQGQVAAFINSSLDFRETEKVLNNLGNGTFKILYVSPEKLANNTFAERIKSLNPSFVFIDEAHCISEWGHNFRPGYRKIKQFIDFIEVKSVSAFTATATDDVRLDIIQQLGLTKPRIFVKGFERENLHLNVIQTTSKKEKLLSLIKDNKGSKIIYASTRKNTEEVAEYLRANKIDAVYYHAGLTAELRRIIHDDFSSGRVKNIIATNAFGMGIDKSDIRMIVHYNMPGTLENYYQEIGRAGRDGKSSQIYLLYEKKDELIQRYFISNSNPSRLQIEGSYNALCDRYNIALNTKPEYELLIDKELLSLLDIKKIPYGIFESSLKILEESGYVKRKSENLNKHFCKFLLEPNRLNAYIKNFTNNELTDLIIFLVREHGAQIFSAGSYLNIPKTSQILDIPQEEIPVLLTELSKNSVIKYSKPSLTPSVFLSLERVKIENLRLDTERTQKLIEHAENKLDRMIDFVFSEECRFKYILEYFGQIDKKYRCSKCDICSSDSASNHNTNDYLEEIILRTVHESKIPLRTKMLIQILTGKVKNESLKKFPSFGTCTHFKTQELEAAVNSLVRSKMIIKSNGVLSLSIDGTEFFTNLEDEKTETVSNADFESELELFNILHQIRKEAAEKFNQSPNLICPDEVLRLIAKTKPIVATELLQINDFNQRMMNKVGDDFISAIKEFAKKTEVSGILKKNNLPKNISFIHDLVQKKYSLEDIASITKLPEAIISTQIESLLGMLPELEIDYLFAKNELKSIYKKIDEGNTGLKELRSALDNSISYAKLRIALAKKKR